MLLPLALAQFICTYAGTSMNVAISDIARDLHTTINGVQISITLFTLVMAVFMIPGSKLSDNFGRKKCFIAGLILYAVGATIAALAPNLAIFMIGNSLLEGIGTALLIPPVYILITVSFSDVKSRAKAFGVISAMAGVGSALGPLIGGIITTSISWRASFLTQTVVILVILFLSRRIIDAAVKGPRPRLDWIGTFYSGMGLLFIVLGILKIEEYGLFTAKEPLVLFGKTIISVGGISPIWILEAIGCLFIFLFFRHIKHLEEIGKEPLLSTKVFKNRTANLGLITQNIQWLTLQGSSFVLCVFMQTVRDLSAIATGIVLVPATVGILLSSVIAGRLARKHEQRNLIRGGFAITIVGLLLLFLLGGKDSNLWAFAPGLLLMGFGVGVMLTSSVNVVQSAFPDNEQGGISGLSRAISNLGSSFGTAIVGTVLVATAASGNASYLYAVLTMVGFAVIGLIASLLLPQTQKMPAK